MRANWKITLRELSLFGANRSEKHANGLIGTRTARELKLLKLNRCRQVGKQRAADVLLSVRVRLFGNAGQGWGHDVCLIQRVLHTACAGENE